MEDGLFIYPEDIWNKKDETWRILNNRIFFTYLHGEAQNLTNYDLWYSFDNVVNKIEEFRESPEQYKEIEVVVIVKSNEKAVEEHKAIFFLWKTPIGCNKLEWEEYLKSEGIIDLEPMECGIRCQKCIMGKYAWLHGLIVLVSDKETLEETRIRAKSLPLSC